MDTQVNLVEAPDLCCSIQYDEVWIEALDAPHSHFHFLTLVPKIHLASGCNYE